MENNVMQSSEGLKKIIADLENMGALHTPPLPARRPARSGLPVAGSLKQRVLDRISAEPPRVRTDCEGRIVEINPAFCSLCGFSYPEIKGRKPVSLLQGPDTEQAPVETLRNAIRSGSACEAELFNYHKNGTRYRVRIQVTPIRDASGDLIGFEAVETKLA